MSVISDGTIRKLLRQKRLVISPSLTSSQIQPSSVDFTLGNSFRVFHNYTTEAIDPFLHEPTLTQEVEIEGGKFVLHPGDFVLATTREWVELPYDIVGRVDGKSSLGRLGLLIHATAGFIDPGFRGQVTLELSNVSRLPIKLTPGMKICQVSFMYLDRAAERPYGHPELSSKYQDQSGATASEYSQNMWGHLSPEVDEARGLTGHVPEVTP